MSLIYSYNDLQALAARGQCCAADLAYKALKTELYNLPDTKCMWDKYKFVKRAVFILKNYIPNGTLIEEGYVSDALIDLATITTGSISGAIVVDGQVIGIVPEGTYATTEDAIAAVVLAVNTHVPTTGFTATNNFDYTITISAPPGSGNALNNSVVTVVINPLYAIETLIDQRNPYVVRHSVYIDDPAHPMYGTLFVICTNGPVGAEGKILVIRDGVIVTEVLDTFSVRHFTIAFNAALNKLYLPDSSPPNLLRYRDLTAPLFPSTPTAPPIYTFLVQSSQYSPIDDVVYSTSPSNNVYRVDSTAPQGTYLTPLAAGTGTTFLEIDRTSGATSGHVWLTTGTSVIIMDPSVNPAGAVLTTIAGVNPQRLFFYDGNGVDANARMYITNGVTNTIDIYNLDGTPDTIGWFTTSGVPSDVTYNPTYNHFFVATSTLIQVVRPAGTLKQDIVFPAGQIHNDPKNNKIYAIRDAVSGANAIAVIHYTNDGSQEFEETLTNGIPNTYQEEGDQCLSEEEIMNIIEQYNRFCCNNCFNNTDITRDI